MTHINVTADTHGKLRDVANQFHRAASLEELAEQERLEIVFETEYDGLVSFRIEGTEEEINWFMGEHPEFRPYDVEEEE